MSAKDYKMFDSIMKKTDKLSDNVWKATTAKRQSVVIPDGARIFDTDLNKMFLGDGVVQGGISDTVNSSFRVVPVNAASSGGTTPVGGTAATDLISGWDDLQYLRTGDGITLAAGTGTLPSGLSAQEYFISKPSDVTSTGGQSNTAQTCYLHTTRTAAISGTGAVDILASGAEGWTAVASTIGVQGYEDILHIDPAGAAVSVILPDSDSVGNGFNVMIKKDTGANAVTIKEADASGNVVASGSMTVDGTAGYETLNASMADYLGFVSYGSEWFTVASGSV